jgi:hypothetical protein
LHDLDRIDKHRLLHTTVAASFGTLLDPGASRNVRCIGPGFMRVFRGIVETETPIALIYGIHPIDPSSEVHVEIRPALDIGLEVQSIATGMPLMRLLTDFYTYIDGTVLRTLTSDSLIAHRRVRQVCQSPILGAGGSSLLYFLEWRVCNRK